MSEEMITITKAEYDSLVEASDWLECLNAAGVDNWEGMSYAFDIQRGEEI